MNRKRPWLEPRAFLYLRYNFDMPTFTIAATVRSYPRLPYEHIKNDILGRRYILSLVFVGEKRAQTLNKTHRNKTYAPNVLSFPLSPSTGEIYITPTVAKREAKKRDMTLTQYVGFLFIHGCLHLRGHAHGKRMEKLEEKYMCTFFRTD